MKLSPRPALTDISLQDFALFEAISRHNSLAAAAREIGARSPFLTKAIQRIENRLNLVLLNRTVSGITLTAEGLQFLKLCKEILATVDNSSWSSKNVQYKQNEFISISGSVFLLAHLIAPFVAPALANEQVGVRLVDMFSTQMTSTESLEHMNAMIHCDPLNFGKAWKSYPVGTAEWILCARSSHPLSARETEKEVLQYPFVGQAIFGSHGFRQGTDNCPVPLKERRRGSEVSTAEIGIHIVRQTNQLIYLPEIQARHWIANGDIRVIEVKGWPPVRMTVMLSLQQDRMKQRWVQTIIKAMETGLQKR